MYNYNETEYFLATTANEEFWDTSKAILYLGEWCRRYSKRDFWEPLNGNIVNTPWDDNEKIKHAYFYINDVYERLLPLLADQLNLLHNVNFGLRYWRILLGPWLQTYISAIYDRYMTLKIVIDNYPRFTTIGLSEKLFITPRDTLEFNEKMKTDLYNLQIFTRILNNLGIEFPRKKIIGEKDFFEKKLSNNFLKLLIKKIHNNMIKRGKKEHIIIKNSYFPRLTELKLLLNTLGRVRPCYDVNYQLPLAYLNVENRRMLKGIHLNNDEFELLLIKLLPEDLPVCFIESYEFIKNIAQYEYPRKTKVIYSANSWYFDEPFKQWSALSAEQGTVLVGAQHGGNYGSLAFMNGELHELMITDRYYSWGWSRSDFTSKVIPMPSSKLTNRSLIGASNKKEGILYVGTIYPRYLMQFPTTIVEFNKYVNSQLLFANAISPAIRSQMRVRLHREDHGWDFSKRWKEHYPEVSLEKWDVSFLKSLKNSRLYVCDHLSTTFLEALSSDIPTILFWNYNSHELKTEAKPFYEELRAVEILHDTPESAANLINTIYQDVETWWNDKKRQSIRQRFCNQFARTSPNAIEEWTSEFNLLLKAVNVGSEKW
jgi:putative transferase (TIGR04331 family)